MANIQTFRYEITLCCTLYCEDFGQHKIETINKRHLADNGQQLIWWSPIAGAHLIRYNGDYRLIHLGLIKYFQYSKTAGLLKLWHWSNTTQVLWYIFKLDHFLPKSLINGSVWSSLIWGVLSSMSKAEPEKKKLHLNTNVFESDCERKQAKCKLNIGKSDWERK